MPLGSPNPDPVSDQKMSFFTPVFRPVLYNPYLFFFQTSLRNSFHLNSFESYYKFMREEITGIYCVVSGVKHHSLSYLSVVMTLPVEFRQVNLVSNRYEKSFKMA